MNERTPLDNCCEIWNENGNLKENKSGLTSVITTVAIIAIIMGFIVGPYLMVIIPDQIKRNEATHNTDVEESFLGIRTAINTELDHDIPNMVLTTRLKLGTDNENLFVVGGSGKLEANPIDMLLSIHSYFDAKSIYARGGGNIKYTSKNLYYEDNDFTYETGGIIESQNDKNIMKNGPNFDLTRRRVIKTIGLDTSFCYLSGANTTLNNIFLINTLSSSVTFDRARISWIGGNATTLEAVRIGSAPNEWTGSAISDIVVTFSSQFSIENSIETMNLVFDAEMENALIQIELYTTDSRTITADWPITHIDTTANVYDIEVPAENAKKFSFKNICSRSITIKNIAVSWVGDAQLWKIDIPSHGGEVWNASVPGIDSPANLRLTKNSIFHPGEIADVKLSFTGNIDDKNLNIKFISENSTNMAAASYPVDLNETYVNASFSIVTLVTPTGNNTQTSGKSSRLIRTTLISSEENRYIWRNGESIVLNITTSNDNAWFEYLNHTLIMNTKLVWDYDGPGAFQGDYYITKTQITSELVNINMVFNSIYKLDCLIGIIKVELS